MPKKRESADAAEWTRKGREITPEVAAKAARIEQSIRADAEQRRTTARKRDLPAAPDVAARAISPQAATTEAARTSKSPSVPRGTDTGNGPVRTKCPAHPTPDADCPTCKRIAVKAELRRAERERRKAERKARRNPQAVTLAHTCPLGRDAGEATSPADCVACNPVVAALLSAQLAAVEIDRRRAQAQADKARAEADKARAEADKAKALARIVTAQADHREAIRLLRQRQAERDGAQADLRHVRNTRDRLLAARAEAVRQATVSRNEYLDANHAELPEDRQAEFFALYKADATRVASLSAQIERAERAVAKYRARAVEASRLYALARDNAARLALIADGRQRSAMLTIGR